MKIYSYAVGTDLLHADRWTDGHISGNSRLSQFYEIACEGQQLVVPWFRPLVAGLSPRRPGFDRLAVGTGSSPTAVAFLLSVSFHHCSIIIFIHMLLLPGGKMREAWGPSKNNVLSEIGGT